MGGKSKCYVMMMMEEITMLAIVFATVGWFRKHISRRIFRFTNTKMNIYFPKGCGQMFLRDSHSVI